MFEKSIGNENYSNLGEEFFKRGILYKFEASISTGFFAAVFLERRPKNDFSLLS